MNHYDALKLLALRAVMKPDADAQYRSICRWYSKTFHTPLHVVDELPEDDVLIAHFEEAYEDMGDDDRQELLGRLLESEEARKARQRAKDEEEAEAFAFAQRMAAEAKQAEAKAKIADVKPVVKPSSMLHRKEAKLPSSFEKLEPDVSVKFVDAGEFEKELEGFGAMGPREKK